MKLLYSTVLKKQRNKIQNDLDHLQNIDIRMELILYKWWMGYTGISHTQSRKSKRREISSGVEILKSFLSVETHGPLILITESTL
jgi:hypothetical protein